MSHVFENYIFMQGKECMAMYIEFGEDRGEGKVYTLPELHGMVSGMKVRSLCETPCLPWPVPLFCLKLRKHKLAFVMSGCDHFDRSGWH